MSNVSATSNRLQEFAELEVDEAQAIAQRLGTEGVMDAMGNQTVWLVVLCVCGLAVAAALLILAGQRRRERRYSEEPTFDAYAVGDDDYAAVDDDLASVEISNAPSMPWQSAAEEIASEDARAAENVVPLRSPDVEAAPAQKPDPEEAPARYAFAAGGATAAGFGGSAYDSGYGHRAEPEHGARQEPTAQDPAASASRPEPLREPVRDSHREPRQEFRPMAKSYDDRPRPYADDDQPFVAPFIREDIERAERRQAERIETLRDEVSRQFQSMKSENASRLDLFVSAVDRKLETLGHHSASAFGESDLQRVTEGSVRPVVGQLERLLGQVSTQEQRLADLAQLIELRLGDLPSVRADLHETTAAVGTLRERTAEAAERMDLLTGLVREQSGVLGEMDGLREDLARIERALLDRASEDGSTSVALTEVVRGTLAEGTYAFAKRLPNGETADCLISFEGHGEQIAIDAGFPMEAFDQLPTRDAVRKNLPQAKAAEDHFRRAILRAILAAADRCIVPGETTDSCLLFLPSEAAYTTLHDRFGDLVRDAQRARVWLTSPSTLMGTLNLLSNLMGSGRPVLRETDAEERAADEKRAADVARRDRARADADKREAERRAMREEIKTLRERAAGLAGELDKTRGTLSELIDTTDRLSSDDDYREPDWAEDDREDRYDD